MALSTDLPPVMPWQLGSAKKSDGLRRMQALGRLKAGEQNKTERAYAQHLDQQKLAGLIQWYRFEPMKLKLAEKTTLTVDFAVLRADGVLELHDVKGSWAIYTEDARVKMKVAAEAFPFVFKVVVPRSSRHGGGWEMREV